MRVRFLNFVVVYRYGGLLENSVDIDFNMTVVLGGAGGLCHDANEEQNCDCFHDNNPLYTSQRKFERQNLLNSRLRKLTFGG